MKDLMSKIKIFLIIFALLLSLNCKNKKQRIEIDYSNNKETILNNTSSKYSNQKLSPEIFFKITLEINSISKKYKNIQDDEKIIQSNLKKIENKIDKIYQKHNITKDKFNKFGEENYKGLESYLKAHPEIDQKLRSAD